MQPARAPRVALRPSEYTSALIRVLRGKAAQLRGASVLEIGSGSGDGRQLLNPFLDGLAQHLASGGRAVITHNAFVSVQQSRSLLRRHGLALRIVQTFLVNIPDLKLELLTPGILASEEGRTIFRYGPHAFADMHFVEIGAAGDFI